MKNEKLKKFLFDKPSNIYMSIANVIINISWVFLLGIGITKSFTNTITIIIIWSISLLMGKAKHYKSPLKCFLMQVALFTSLFLSTYINIYIAMLFTVYSKFILSGNANIEDFEPEEDDKPSIDDFSLWNPQNKSVHQPLIDYLDKRYDRINNIPRTVGEVAGAYPDNVLLITMNGHIVCAKYGVIYDSFDCRNRIAEYCWKVK